MPESENDPKTGSIHIQRIPAVEADVIEEIVEHETDCDYHWDDGLVIEGVDPETKTQIVDRCYERGRDHASRSDYEGAQWCKDAGAKVDHAEIEVP